MSEPVEPQSNDPNAKSDPWTQSSETKEPVASPPENQKKEAVSERDWERNLINRLAFASLNEQRRARRWSVLFKSLTFLYLFFILYLFIPKEASDITVGKHTALIEIDDVIDTGSRSNADDVVGALRDAVRDNGTQGIILRINSPGGSPVQAGYIYDEINRLRNLHPDIKIYAVVTDLAASAAYYIASAADEIYADKASIVGSIGVLMDGFGFVDTMKKLGVERRLMTAGEHKGFLDPFSPVKPEDKQHMQQLLGNVHTQFIDAVKRGRGDRIKTDPKLYSGLVWSGDKALELGLVDGLGSASFVAREVIKSEKIIDFTYEPNYFDRFAEKIGASVAKSLVMMNSKFGMH